MSEQLWNNEGMHKMMAWLFTKKNNSSGFLKCKYYRFQFIESALESCVPNCQN